MTRAVIALAIAAAAAIGFVIGNRDEALAHRNCKCWEDYPC